MSSQPLPRYTPPPRLPAEVERIIDQPTPTSETIYESPSWIRGIPLIARNVSGAIHGTQHDQLAEDGAFD